MGPESWKRLWLTLFAAFGAVLGIGFLITGFENFIAGRIGDGYHGFEEYAGLLVGTSLLVLSAVAWFRRPRIDR